MNSAVKSIWLMIICTFMVSCRQTQDAKSWILNEFNSKINDKMATKFPDSVITSFNGPFAVMPDGIKLGIRNYCGLFFWDSLSNSEFNSIVKNFNVEQRISYDQIIKVGSEKNVYPTSFKGFRNNNAFFVPDYQDKLNPLDELDLSDSLETYILDKRKGEFLKKEFIKNQNSFPEEFKHGYSKGISVDLMNNIVIYWLIMW